ncbi:hypothetical protein M378DRAFT_195832 [Amanita muscaria Koide BX008]|uniref:asparaginase n=1 Tax=Amanita muscaria (strain Koide BX008) TaxID=946122 RepID=A0A0C2XLI6_AMAMK|nr:hypothetical protein M378DRAFT_195832 [Amanita muscaria Koide BX008]
MELSQPPDESRVLVIYTGGTIGMLVGHQGYVPEPDFLTETLRSQNRFHDPLQDSFFANAGTVQGFREWSSSGRSSPQTSDSPTVIAHRTLPVRSTRPLVRSASLAPNRTAELKQPDCVKISENVYEAQLPSLVTPRSKVPGGTRSKSIRYAVLEWNPLLDSSNFSLNDWIRVATEIELNYQTFDAFVVLHGTDTMSYTSSALSFLLEDLGKTVILTGAQIPMSQLRNDAVDNLMGALTIAGHFIIPECCLYFNHTLYRGNRVSKLSSYSLSAFDSPNFPPLVNVGIDIVVNWDNVIRQTSLRRFKAHKEMSPHVATLRLFPGVTTATVSAFFMPPIRGVVLETFGAGNAPQRPDLLKVIKEACDRGVIVVAISQCVKGSVSAAYETGQTLLKAGVIPGSDMTPECALTKLCYLLSKPELSTKDIRESIGIPLRGELTRPASTAPGQPKIDDNLEKIQDVLAQFVRLSSPASVVPKITVSSELPDVATQEATAPWTWTAAEAATTEAVLLPFLIHLAAARDDLESLKFCLAPSSKPDASSNPVIEVRQYGSVAGDLVNCIDPAAGRSPLHVAAINGNLRSVDFLLRCGALVHLRDILGHTALYYATRQGYEAVVEQLVQVGATLGGTDSSYVDFAISNALQSRDSRSLSTWAKAGVTIPEGSPGPTA